MDGFVMGVYYYNEMNGAAVQAIGWNITIREGLFTNDFFSIEKGREMAEALLDQGVDILLPVAGPLIGMGTAEVVKQHENIYIIGVDDDWAVIFPELSGIVLTSIEKRLDKSVINAFQAIVDGNFTGGNHIGNLANGGVSFAPFHSLDSLVSESVKNELERIKADIISGKIKTMPEPLPED